MSTAPFTLSLSLVLISFPSVAVVALNQPTPMQISQILVRTVAELNLVFDASFLTTFNQEESSTMDIKALFLVFCAIVTVASFSMRRTPTVQSTATQNNASPRTVLGTPTRSQNKHIEDAREYLLMDGRAAVRQGRMTVEEFERYTGVKF
jgi:hypothetical protein